MSTKEILAYAEVFSNYIDYDIEEKFNVVGLLEPNEWETVFEDIQRVIDEEYLDEDEVWDYVSDVLDELNDDLENGSVDEEEARSRIEKLFEEIQDEFELGYSIPRENARNAQLTFFNGPDDLEKKGREYLKSRLEDIYTIVERNAWDRIDEIVLCADYVKWEDGDEYGRIQFSWGGPSDELRIRGDKIEYVYLDWYVGIGFDVSNIDYIREFVDYFKELGVFDETTEV